ncbi:hypothetical protein IWX49DRAFT_551248 [Phyllosticta citricarpa]
MVRNWLYHVSTTTITRLMVSKDGSGAITLDFEISEELSKPWTAAINCHSRREIKDWRWRDGLPRFVLTLVVGVCLLLQGAAMNTVAIPKARWWPNSRFINPADDDRFFFTNKKMHVANEQDVSLGAGLDHAD